jgi:hypothetical protein
MAEKKTRLKPSRKGGHKPAGQATRARMINDRLKAQGRWFGDSTEIIRADRDSRV